MARLFAAAVLACTLALSGTLTWAHDETPGAIETYLHGLVDEGAITEVQHQHIDRLYFANRLPQLHAWLEAQEASGQITSDTHRYLDALLNLSAPDPTPAAAAAAVYTDNGNVTLLGRIDAQPPSTYYGDSASTGTLYNGIWGYAAGSREYALQSNSFGLHIIDVTDPAASFRVQFIDMSGGASPPKGRVWRDVDTYTDSVGKTYAYVGAQAGGRFWVVDLSYLSETLPDGVDSNPIPPAAVADRGRTNYGHTVSVNRELGLLFLNTANNGSTLGCQIFDLQQDPFDPPVIGGWSGSGRDCHDSFSRGSVPGTGGKDLLYSADGYATRYRILDITSVRLGGAPTLLGESAAVSGIYAHSHWLDDDSRYLYAFEEFNVRDIGVYDVSDPTTPTLVTTFQYSGDAAGNSLVHNGQVRGQYLLTAYYEAGLRVFDISNPTNPVEVGKYETWRDPDGDGTFNQTITGGYNGAWNLHAFLPSGNVLVSDMKSGTFIFRIDPVAPPDAPSGLSAAPGDGQADLFWAAADRATGYSVHRATTSGGPYATVASNIVGTSFVDTGLVNGTTYFYVVTATNAGGEGVTSNQASAIPAVQALGPDLAVTVLASPPSTAFIGGVFSVSDTTVNQGTASTLVKSKTRFYVSADAVKNGGDTLLKGLHSVPILAAGASHSKARNVTIPASTAPGTYFLMACADDRAQVAEGDETNNCTASASTIQLLAATPADLVVSAVTNPPAAAAAGSQFSVTDTTANLGPGATLVKSKTRFYLSADTVKGSGDKRLKGARTVPILAVGASHTGSRNVTIPLSTVPGSYFLIACADDRDAIIEGSNEGNNCRASTSQVTVTP